MRQANDITVEIKSVRGILPHVFFNPPPPPETLGLRGGGDKGAIHDCTSWCQPQHSHGGLGAAPYVPERVHSPLTLSGTWSAAFSPWPSCVCAAVMQTVCALVFEPLLVVVFLCRGVWEGGGDGTMQAELLVRNARVAARPSAQSWLRGSIAQVSAWTSL